MMRDRAGDINVQLEKWKSKDEKYLIPCTHNTIIGKGGIIGYFITDKEHATEVINAYIDDYQFSLNKNIKGSPYAFQILFIQFLCTVKQRPIANPFGNRIEMRENGNEVELHIAKTDTVITMTNAVDLLGGEGSDY